MELWTELGMGPEKLSSSLCDACPWFVYPNSYCLKEELAITCVRSDTSFPRVFYYLLGVVAV
jgi:hypothetical protein